jgi:outer membrane protein OmpA-like peptidoglycan-associated protein
MRITTFVFGIVLAVAGCTHPQNQERKDPLTDQVTGPMRATDPAFLKDDPASHVSCAADRDCPQGTMCVPDRHACFTSYPEAEMTKIDSTCPLVPLYFAFDSVELVPEAQKWVRHDAACLKARGAGQVVLDGFADARGDAAYNRDLSQRRAGVVKQALADEGTTIDVVVRGQGATDPVMRGSTEHDFAYNRRVELKTKDDAR